MDYNNLRTSTTNHSYNWIWRSVLGVFVLAGSTGALMRFGLIYGFPWDLQFTNIRHAHSHLMYFGWVTPALMALIATRLPFVTKRPLSPRFRLPIILSIIFGLLSYIPFMLYGYRSATLIGRQIPLGVMTSGLNILGWYAFIRAYWQETRGLVRNYPLQLWDTAVYFLIFASAGGWGLPVVTFLNVQNPFWSLALTHIFLDLFAYGWFVLAMLGLIYSGYPALAKKSLARHSITLTVSGLPVIFLLGMPSHVVPPIVRWLGSAGGVLVAFGIMGHIIVLWPIVNRRWQIPLLFLGLTAVSILASTIPPVAQWAIQNGLRILFLHWLLLGFISLGLGTVAEEVWGNQLVWGRKWFVLAVILLILSLFPISGLWPLALNGRWALYATAWGALGPTAVAMVALIFGQTR